MPQLTLPQIMALQEVMDKAQARMVKDGYLPTHLLMYKPGGQDDVIGLMLLPTDCIPDALDSRLLREVADAIDAGSFEVQRNKGGVK